MGGKLHFIIEERDGDVGVIKDMKKGTETTLLYACLLESTRGVEIGKKGEMRHNQAHKI